MHFHLMIGPQNFQAPVMLEFSFHFQNASEQYWPTHDRLSQKYSVSEMMNVETKVY